jgi:flagellar P-ring protein precursor FlgI
MVRKFLLLIAVLGGVLNNPLPASANSRIKDLVYFEGIRDNQLIGYGLVVGLNGTGDNLKNNAFTEKGFIDLLSKLGMSTRGANLQTRNIAAVVVTAQLPPFSRPGSKIDVQVSTIGSAKSIKGGTLLATPLLGADGQVYAVSQGAININSSTDARDKGSATAGYVSNGAIIEKEIPFALNDMEDINLALRNPDLSTARQIEVAVNAAVQDDIAFARDPGTVNVKIPKQFTQDVVGLLSLIEGIMVQPDTIAKIVIDEASGTVVIGDNVNISKVAVAQGGLVVEIDDEAIFSGELALTETDDKPAEPGTKLAIMPDTARLNDLVQGLNRLGVKPKELVAILKTIKQAGALQAEIETR